MFILLLTELVGFTITHLNNRSFMFTGSYAQHPCVQPFHLQGFAVGHIEPYPSNTRQYRGVPFLRINEIASPQRHDMYFTLLFEKEEGPTEIYELVFHPCPVWFKGGSTGLDEAVCIPSHGGPHYVMGDFRCLLDNAEIERNRKVGIVCHDSGLGSEEDLNLLMSEMKSEGFSPQLMFRN